MIFRSFTLGVGAAIGVMMGLWIADRDPPIVIEKSAAEDGIQQPGGVAKIRYNVRRFRECSVHIDRVLLDSAGARYDLVDTDYAKPPGPLGEDSYAVTIRLPDSAAPGMAIYRVITVYRCNIIHRWFYPITTGPFDTHLLIHPRDPNTPVPPELMTPNDGAIGMKEPENFKPSLNRDN